VIRGTTLSPTVTGDGKTGRALSVIKATLADVEPDKEEAPLLWWGFAARHAVRIYRSQGLLAADPEGHGCVGCRAGVARRTTERLLYFKINLLRCG